MKNSSKAILAVLVGLVTGVACPAMAVASAQSQTNRVRSADTADNESAGSSYSAVVEAEDAIAAGDVDTAPVVTPAAQPGGSTRPPVAGVAAPRSTQLVEEPRFLKRHLRFLATEAGTRFRYLDKGERKVSDRDLQYKVSSRVQLNLVGEGNTYIQARGESGCSFTSSYDYSGVGLNRGHWSFNLKSLFVGQNIGRHLGAQAGSIEYDWGAGGEATYADYDAWLEGYRLRYSGSGAHGMPDKVSATIGYVGDFAQPNAFARLPRLGEHNYIQILVTKKFFRNFDTSAEFDSIHSIRYTREALHGQKLRLRVLDELSLETLARTSDKASFGWSSSLYRGFDSNRRFRLGVFYSDMPKGIFLNGKTTVLLNGDSYGLGKRIGPSLRVSPFKDFEVSAMASGRLDSTPGMRYRGQLAVRYQLSSLLNRALP